MMKEVEQLITTTSAETASIASTSSTRQNILKCLWSRLAARLSATTRRSRYSALEKRGLVTFILVILTLNICMSFHQVNAIGCFKCTSVGTTGNSTCHDPFNPGLASDKIYEHECKSGIADRIGLFPARYCLKISGTKAGSNEPLTIRTCTVTRLLDSDASHSSFTILTDNNTQIQVVSGIISSCKDDGCNRAAITTTTTAIVMPFLLVLLLTF